MIFSNLAYSSYGPAKPKDYNAYTRQDRIKTKKGALLKP
jgi:hypothetical protein